MATKAEFTGWLYDFQQRFPAVAAYTARYDVDVLTDTWHRSTEAFALETLRAVTDGILSGRLEPVDNMQLGQFGSEIAKRCRTILEQERRAADQAELKQTAAEHRDSYTPLIGKGMQWMRTCAVACEQIIQERNIPTKSLGEYLIDGCRLRPETDCYDAAVVLADDHTAAEGQQALCTLARHGITWEEIKERAGR